MHEQEPYNAGELSEVQARKFFIETFRFAQGDQKLPGHIYHYIHTTHPDWKFSVSLRDELLRTMPERLQVFLGRIPHMPISLADIRESCDEFIVKMHTVLSSEETIPREVSVANITGGITDRDHNFLCCEGKRSYRSSAIPDNTYSDEYHSFICHFALREGKPDVGAFEQMFQDMRFHIYHPQFPQSFPEVAQKLLDVVEVYNAHHKHAAELPRWNEAQLLSISRHAILKHIHSRTKQD